MKVLVQWQPYAVLGTYSDDTEIEAQEGQSLLNSIPDNNYIPKKTKWRDDIEWGNVLKLYEEKRFYDIMRLHNDEQWSELRYCCDFHLDYIRMNIENYVESRKSS